MHALTLARQRLRARIQHPRTPQPVRLAHGLVENGQSRFLPILSSSLAQDILIRGYDARTLERIYSNRPSGDLGLVGQLTDRVVLDLPTHQALRERLEATVGEMCAAVILGVRAGEPEFRVLVAGCGLGAEIAGLAERLQKQNPEAFSRVRCWGVDVDPDGHVLPEAARRARAAGLPTKFIREDLRRRREVSGVAAQEGPFHLISCLSFSATHSLDETAELVRFYARILAPGGTLLVDRWEGADKSRVAGGLGIQMRAHGVNAFHTMLREAGLTVDREHHVAEGGCVLVVARKLQS